MKKKEKDGVKRKIVDFLGGVWLKIHIPILEAFNNYYDRDYDEDPEAVPRGVRKIISVGVNDAWETLGIPQKYKEDALTIIVNHVVNQAPK